ncbi:MAG: hypothetical protein NTX25_24150 [Proteobacteria bacterium]|nr:hypothetical protein [Pseudomonadota bacterium]
MRNEIIENLINLDRSLEEIRMKLKTLSWDSDEEILMTKESAKSVLARYINDSIDLQTLTEWANMIEGREDICYEQPCSNDLKQLIFDLANPDLQESFNKNKAKDWLLKLK